MAQVPNLKLNNGIEMPQLGFGVFQIQPDDVVLPVRAAIEAGYTLIDTAAGYANEAGVGRAIRDSGAPRDQFFVTTKLTNSAHGYDRAMRAFDGSLAELGLEYVDLYLIHWPVPAKDLYVETWQALESIYADGRARAIGVSNFTREHLQRVMAETGTVPAVNQVELHPGFPQQALMAFHAEHGIVTESWAPIGQGKGILEEPVIVATAARYSRTPAQVVLRWHLQLGNVAIPKSVTPERIRANIEVFDFELSDEDMVAITAIGHDHRLGPDPDHFN
jgi:2,5-diketo-D-gluconate reductase A